ncbi:MAG: shikimate dehydrogenase [Clostridia bacterium]|nr:shikimate dehydrogenase [Clostridia bacterium]
MEYGLIGEKLSHSFSAEIHKRFFGLDYRPCEIARSALEEFFSRREFKGINVTAPYKQAVIPLLDGLSEPARVSGAVNVIINENGRLTGYNTDIHGMRGMFARSGMDFKGKKTLVLGSGGTSKTALSALDVENCACVLRVSRTGKPGCITYEEAVKKHSDAEIIINATPCGTSPDLGGEAIDAHAFPRLEAAFDAVYNPLRTRLCIKASEAGAYAEGGLYMLVAQAVKTAELFTAEKYGEDTAEKIYNTLLREKQNAVITGMPGAGKTAVGAELAQTLRRDFYDTDEIIKQKTGISAGDIIKKYGEPRFREIEREVIASLAAVQGAVISTGGGAVLDRKNLRALKANGKLYYIDVPPDKLAVPPGRPLTPDRTALERVYGERHGIYLKNCDKRIPGGAPPCETARIIAEDYEK